MNNIITNIKGQNPKTTMGYVFAFAVAGVLGWAFLTMVLPILTTIAWNLVSFGIALVIGLFLFYFLTSKATWRAIRYFGEAGSQKLLGWAIEMNPLNIMEYQLHETEKDVEKLLEYRDQLNGNSINLKEKIDSNDKELRMAYEKKKICEDELRTDTKNSNLLEQLEIALNDIAITTDYIDSVKPVYNDTLKLIDFVDRAYRTAKLELTNSKNTLKKRRDLYETVTTASATVAKAWKALMGDKGLNDDSEKALEFLQKDISVKIGKIKSGIKVTSQFMDSKDLDNAVKLKTALNTLNGIDLGTVNYSDTIDSNETKIEMSKLDSGSNRFLNKI